MSSGDFDFDPDAEEFAWRTIEYLEDRIQMMDNKANAMLALVTGVGFALPVVSSLRSSPVKDFSTFEIVVGLTLYAMFFLALIFWSLVIRPKWRRTDSTHSSTAMWWTPERSPNPSFSYSDIMTTSERQRALRTTHEKLLEMTARKMWHYDRAMRWTRLLVPMLLLAALWLTFSS